MIFGRFLSGSKMFVEVEDGLFIALDSIQSISFSQDGQGISAILKGATGISHHMFYPKPEQRKQLLEFFRFRASK